MIDPDRLLAALNPPQREAVTHGEGPLLILAGAGSGKTRVITHRIAWLVGVLGVDPREIVAVTFTNKAAGEMKERAERLLGFDIAGAYLGTFHALGLRILRANAAAAGLPPTFVVYDTADQQAIARAVLKEDLGFASDPPFTPRDLLARISRAKIALLDPADLHDRARLPHERWLAQAYEAYEDRLRRAGAVDFDDLLVRVIRLFRAEPAIAERYANRTRFLLVDEYQDINHVQYLLIRALAATHRNPCCVGDEDQSIYAFRGADIRNILEFERDYPDAKVVKLEQNYRSTANILEAATGIISRNTERHAKTLWTEAPGGEKVRVHEAADDREEADFVVEELLRRARVDGVPLDGMAILYRTNAMSRLIEDRLTARNIPYRVVGSLRFYDRKEIKDVLAWLRLLVHPGSDQDLLRAISTPPRGIGQKTLDRVRERADREGTSLWEAIVSLLRDPGDLPGRAVTALGNFVGTVRDLAEISRGVPVAATILQLLEVTGYPEYVEKNHPHDHEGRLENLDALVSAAREHDEAGGGGDVAGFLDRVSLRSDTDDVQGERGPSLMTVHAAKGLEFDGVFVIGLNEGVFPHARANESEADLEEERRLMYVAVTRARKFLVLTHGSLRRLYGSPVWHRPSRFLEEIPERVVVRTGGAATVAGGARDEGPFRAGFRRSHPAAAAGAGFPARTGSPRPWGGTPPAGTARRTGELHYEPDPESEGGAFQPGQRVVHPKFGGGVIIAAEGSGDRVKLKIRFDNGRLRKIMPGYTTLLPG